MNSKEMNGIIDNIFEFTFEIQQQDTDVSAINFWCKQITESVKLNTSTKDTKKFSMTAELRKGRISIKMGYSPSFKDIVLETIKRYLEQMSKENRLVFEEILRNYDEQGNVSFIDIHGF